MPDNEGKKDVTEYPVPAKVQIGSSPVYITGKRLGKGGFGQVFLGTRSGKARSTQKDPKPTEVALKFEHKTSKGCTFNGPPYEWSVYSAIGDVYGVPKIYHKGIQGDFYVMIMDILGKSLWDVWSSSGQTLSPQFVACVAIEAIHILEKLHETGFVHGDVKPENFLLGAAGTPNADRLFLVDFGLAQRWKTKHSNGTVLVYDQKPDDFRGTIRYASVHAHLGRSPSRRDDFESLAYTILFLLFGRLPWQGYQGDNKAFLVAKHKMTIRTDMLLKNHHPCFKTFIDAVLDLKYEETPRYSGYIKLFEAVLSPAARGNEVVKRPLQVDKALSRADVKRGRDEEADLRADFEEGKRRRTRQGYPACQWITVYNKHAPMKQRYHYNVSHSRLDVHISKGYDDDLFITSVCAIDQLWALIMDAGPAYTKQTYMATTKGFLPKEWILEQWDKGFYITSVAGNSANGSLVVMSKGVKYTQQSYKISDKFPYEWIKKKWRESFYVTSMATSKSTWAIVMSKNVPFIDQKIELDFQYPSEGIHKRWDQGYRITAVGATQDQAAFALSIPKPGSMDETQETLRTSTFPCAHVKDKWAKDLYISEISYGRTVS